MTRPYPVRCGKSRAGLPGLVRGAYPARIRDGLQVFEPTSPIATGIYVLSRLRCAPKLRYMVTACGARTAKQSTSVRIATHSFLTETAMKSCIAAALAACLALGLASCQTASRQKVWMRTDGKRAADNPAFQTEFLAQKAQCRAFADQTARASMPPQAPVMQQSVVIERPRYPGELDFISDDVAGRAYREAQMSAPRRPDPEAFAAAMEGCMARRGYVLVDMPSGG